MPAEPETLNIAVNSAELGGSEVALTASDACRLLGNCIELIDLCSKMTGKNGPSVGTIVEYARNEVLGEVLEVGA